MGKTNSQIESIAYYAVRAIAGILRRLPVNAALAFGRGVGWFMFYVDRRHKELAFANVTKALGHEKSPREIRAIVKKLYKNIGMNIVELFRLKDMTQELYDKYVDCEGPPHIDQAVKEGRGCILLAMHMGNWELANIYCALHGIPYKVLVRPQPGWDRLNDLLNSYRSCNGAVVVKRGGGTRELIKSLKDNQVIAMVVDQGGRQGVRVPFFGRKASMSSGAIRIAMKMNVPVLVSIITRKNGAYHQVKAFPKLDLVDTGNPEQDVEANLKQAIKIFEDYVRQNPDEYVWTYKVWKYSDQSNITILYDGRTGHLRQSQAVAKWTQKALEERGIASEVNVCEIRYRSKKHRTWFAVLYQAFGWFLRYGRHDILQRFITEESYRSLNRVRSDYIISTGTGVAPLNHLLSRNLQAKSVAILKPGLMHTNKFDLVFLPQHDVVSDEYISEKVRIVRGAPNLVTPEYLEEHKQRLLKRFSHLKTKVRFKIGLLIGGDAKGMYVGEDQVRLILRQIKEAQKAIDADLLVTSSRRTPAFIDQLLVRQLRKDPRCPLLILPNREDVPEAIGGILALCDLLIVSGDSISMVSEAASSGKKTIVFFPKTQEVLLHAGNKHWKFINKLNDQGYVLASQAKDVGRSIFDIVKQKINTRPLDDNKTILKAVRKII
ncbi:MAG: mitochondrial fission ELM1 family protein [Candidatus Omnitrophica bacterium]|nr:mitochondrial fission ELM1 family protein [Candidatus Omnitrophota bacterium]